MEYKRTSVFRFVKDAWEFIQKKRSLDPEFAPSLTTVACIFKGSRLVQISENYINIYHAESKAIKNIKDKNSKYDILVLRFSKTGLLGLAKPCMHCSRDIRQSSFIRNVFYSTGTDNQIVKEQGFSIKNELIQVGKLIRFVTNTRLDELKKKRRLQNELRMLA